MIVALMALAFNLFAPNEEASALIAGKTVVAQKVFYGLLPELRERAFAVTGIKSAEITQRVLDEIAAVPRGITWDEAKSGIADALEPDLGEEGSQTRAELLLRTHGFQAFQAGTYRVAQDDENTVALQYLTMEDDRVRLTHAALDGIILPKDDPFWHDHTPPWEWGCRCRVRPMDIDLVDAQREKDAALPPDQKLVIEGPELDQLRQGTLLSDGQRYDVTSPAQKPGGEKAFAWNPNDFTLPIGDLKLRYSEEAWSAFEDWAKNTLIGPGTSLWNSLLSRPASVPPNIRALQDALTIQRLTELASQP